MNQFCPGAPRFYVPPSVTSNSEMELPLVAARHGAVLRLRPGDPIVIFDGQGEEFAAELTLVSGGRARVRILASRGVDRESPLAVSLAQCISSGDRMDLALQKATELGVSKIVPIECERSIVRLSGERADRRLAHWRNVVIAACEQCGRNRVPEVTAMTRLEAFLREPGGNALRLLLDPGADRGLKQLDPPHSVTLLVGPEGGLTPAEKRRGEGLGFVPVRFGPRILRTETAPLAAIAAMQTLWGDC